MSVSPSFLAQFQQANSGLADLQKIAYGTGSLVSGSVTIDTGLQSVSAFTANLTGTGAKTTGAAEVSALQIHTITTGSVVVQGFFNAFVTGASTISVSGTSAFRWIAIGT
jgi:hypothetical protein